MRIIEINIDGLDAGLTAFRRAWSDGLVEPNARISFVSPELLWRTMTGKRWDLLKVLARAEAMSMRAVARAVDRDVRGVHGDLLALMNAGIVKRLENGKVSFPFDAVHIDFVLTGTEI